MSFLSLLLSYIIIIMVLSESHLVYTNQQYWYYFDHENVLFIIIIISYHYYYGVVNTQDICILRSSPKPLLMEKFGLVKPYKIKYGDSKWLVWGPGLQLLLGYRLVLWYLRGVVSGKMV